MQRYWWLTPLLRMMLPPNRIQVKLRQGKTPSVHLYNFIRGQFLGQGEGGGLELPTD